MNRRILVLGAGGFIGRRVIEDLAGDPAILPVAGVRNVHGAAFPTRVEVLALDATKIEALETAVAGVSGVVNCVAGSDDNIVNCAAALAALERKSSGFPRLVHLSSMAVYGNATGTVDETAPLPRNLQGYAGAKVAAELTLAACKSLVTLRPGIVYGPESPLWSGYVGKLIAARRIGNLGEGGRGICNLVYVQDVVMAIKRALTLPAAAGGVFNLAASAAPTWNDYFRLYALALGVAHLPHISTLRLAVECAVVSPTIKIAETVLGSRGRKLPPAIRPWLLNLCRHQIRMNSGRAENTLQMSWHPLEDALRITAKWFREPTRT